MSLVHVVCPSLSTGCLKKIIFFIDKCRMYYVVFLNKYIKLITILYLSISHLFFTYTPHPSPLTSFVVLSISKSFKSTPVKFLRYFIRPYLLRSLNFFIKVVLHIDRIHFKKSVETWELELFIEFLSKIIAKCPNK